MVALGALLPKLNLLRIGDIVQGLSASADLPVVAWGSDAGGFDVGLLRLVFVLCLSVLDSGNKHARIHLGS